MQTTYILFLLLIVIILIQRRNRTVWMKQFMKSKKREEKKEMLELAKRFINKECIIYTFNSQLNGIIKEVSEGAILIENNGSVEAVNLDFVVRLREFPKKKNGKKKALVMD